MSTSNFLLRFDSEIYVNLCDEERNQLPLLRILIAIGSQEYSEHTLKTGAILADRLKANLTVCYVGEKPRERGDFGMKILHDSMANWQIFHPGLEVLRWAYEKIQEWGFGGETTCSMDPAHTIVESGRILAIVPGARNGKIELLLREGETFAEIHKETQINSYFLTVVGGGVKKSVTNKLIQFVDSNIFFAKNYQHDKSYRILIPVDDSAGTQHAVMFGSLVAQRFGMGIDALTVSKKEYFGPGYSSAAEMADLYFSGKNISHKMLRKVGDPATEIAKGAGDDHLIIMGVSHSSSEWRKFFRGTKPGDTVIQAQCPVLLVR